MKTKKESFFVYDEKSRIIESELKKEDHHKVINLATSNKRIKAQEGYCIFYSENEEKSSTKEIFVSNKESIKQQLEVLGIKSSSIYPILDNEINDIVSKYKKLARNTKETGLNIGDELASITSQINIDSEIIERAFNSGTEGMKLEQNQIRY